VPRAADGEGAGRILVRLRLAVHDGPGLAGLKVRDLSAAWWRTPGGCAAAGDGAGRTVAASAVMKARDSSAAWWRTPVGFAAAGDGAGCTVAASAGMKVRTCPLPDNVDPGAVPLPGMGRARWGCLG